MMGRMGSLVVLAEGTVFAGDFRVVRRLSAGGMGSVYAVQQISTGRTRALKLMHPALVENPVLRGKFEQEARIGGRIASEHVVEGIKFTGKGKDGKAIAMEVKADGTLSKDGKVVASFVKNELHDETGTMIFAVDKDGKVTGKDMDKPMAFNDKDELQIDGKPGIVIADDGTPSVTNGAKTDKAPFKFEKLPPKSKRAAVLLVGLMLFARAKAASPVAASASAIVKPPPAPTTKPSAAPSAKPATK